MNLDLLSQEKNKNTAFQVFKMNIKNYFKLQNKQMFAICQNDPRGPVCRFKAVILPLL